MKVTEIFVIIAYKHVSSLEKEQSMNFFKSSNRKSKERYYSNTKERTPSTRNSSKKSFLSKLISISMSPLYPVYTNKAPEPVGPYSQAMFYRLGTIRLMFLSGQIPLDPETSKIVGEDISAQSRQVFENIKAVLESQRMRFSSVIKTLVFLTDLEDFASFNKVYEEYFKDHKPARSCVEVSKLPKGAKVEVEVIATI